MYQVKWEDGRWENLRIIKEYLHDQVWMDEELSNVTHSTEGGGENEHTF